MEGRVLGLDIGDVRIGAALSDPLGITAQPKETIPADDEDAAIERIGELIEETGAVRIVAGMPLDRQGEVGHQGHKVQEFLDQLGKRVGVPIETVDERMTTAIANRAMGAEKVRKGKRKGMVDQLAAQQILQTWLDRQGSGRSG
jgi:putative Holliday junction resolvase